MAKSFTRGTVTVRQLWGALALAVAVAFTVFANVAMAGPPENNPGKTFEQLEAKIDKIAADIAVIKALLEGAAYIGILVGIDIDIKPGSDPNSINCTNVREVIAVAILTTDDFDATTVDHTTVTFEGAYETHVDRWSGLARRHEEDVDNDGDIDLVLHFRLGDTGLTCGSTEGTLTGETFGGETIAATDAVRMIDN